MKRLVLITAIVAGVSLAVAVGIGFIWGPFGGFVRGAGGGGLAIDEQDSLPAAGLEKLSVRVASEDVRFRMGEAGEVRVRLHGRVRVADPAAVPHLKVDRSGPGVEVRVARENGLLPGWFAGELVLELTVPAGWGGALSVHGASGNLFLEGTSDAGAGLAVLEASTASGDIHADSLRAVETSLGSASGSLDIDGLRSERTRLSTASGDIEAKRLAGDVNAGSASGDIALGFIEPPDRVEVSVMSGDVLLSVPPGSGFRLAARSASGRVRCDLPVTLEAADGGGRRNLSGTVGDGRGSVTLGTASGDIRVSGL